MAAVGTKALRAGTDFALERGVLFGAVIVASVTSPGRHPRGQAFMTQQGAVFLAAGLFTRKPSTQRHE